jgi:hypothetical protein
MERRGLVRDRRTGMSLRMEFGAWAEAVLVRFEEALSGRTSSAAVACFRSLCLLR